MIGLGLVQRRTAQFALAALVVLAVAVALGWHAGREAPGAAAAAAAAPWSLPAEAATDAKRDGEILRARRPWGGRAAFRDIDAGPPPAVATARPWALLGTVARDARRFALIRVGPPPAGKVEYRSVGDKMPDGSTLDDIAADAITTRGGSAGRQTVYRLFAKRS